MKKYDLTCIIDDDAIVIFGLKRAMAAIGFTTELLVYDNGLDALEGFEQRIKEGSELPSLIFIDLNMPVMDGWGFLAEYAKIHPAEKAMPTVFIMTSSVDVKDMEKARTYNLEGRYLIKPVSADVLVRILT